VVIDATAIRASRQGVHTLSSVFLEALVWRGFWPTWKPKLSLHLDSNPSAVSTGPTYRLFKCRSQPGWVVFEVTASVAKGLMDAPTSAEAHITRAVLGELRPSSRDVRLTGQ
jgi:hypothetical protein